MLAKRWHEIESIYHFARELKQCPSEWTPWNYPDTMRDWPRPRRHSRMKPAWQKRIVGGHGSGNVLKRVEMRLCKNKIR
jgi:hypothetical protein